MTKIAPYREKVKVGSGQGKEISHDVINVPVSIFSWCAKNKLYKKHLQVYLRLKAAGWNRVSKKNNPKEYHILKQAGLLTWKSKDKSIHGIMPLRAFPGKTKKLTRHEILNTKSSLLAYAVLDEHYTSVALKETQLHADSPVRGKKGKRVLKPSRHNGGAALSQMANMFNRDKSWASLMRKACTEAGIASWKRRVEKVKSGSEEETRLKVLICMGMAPHCWRERYEDNLYVEITAKSSYFFTHHGFHRPKSRFKFIKTKEGDKYPLISPCLN